MGEQVAAGLHGGIAQLGEHLPCKQAVSYTHLCTRIVVLDVMKHLRIFIRDQKQAEVISEFR